MPADIADRSNFEERRGRRDLVFQRQIELLGLGGPEIRDHGKRGAERVVGPRVVHRDERREPVADFLSYKVVAGRDAERRTVGRLAIEAQSDAFAAGRVIENAVAAPNHRGMRNLVGQSEARTEILLVRLHAGVLIDAVASGNIDLAGLNIEVRPAVGDVGIGAVIIPTQTDVESQFLGNAPVVGGVQAEFDASLAGPVERVVVSNERGETEDKAGRAVASGALPRIGERGGEVETAVALVGLVDGDLTAAKIGAEFESMLPSVQVRSSMLLVRVLTAEDRQ